MNNNGTSDTKVIVCVPYFNCQNYIRKAVESLLAQTYQDLIIVVINDGDFETPPWQMLSDIDDSRLIRFDSKENRGPYFATQIVLNATTAPYLIIQDADDWSEINRIEVLMQHMLDKKCDCVVSNICEHVLFNDKVVYYKIKEAANSEDILGSKFKHPGNHLALYKTEALRAIGGYYGGFKFGYDILLRNLMAMVFHIEYCSLPLYNSFLRPYSFRQSPMTSNGSIKRSILNLQLKELYQQACNGYLKFLAGNISGYEFFKEIQSITQKNVDELMSVDIAYQSGKLAHALKFI